VLGDCLCARNCLDFCIQLVGAKPCCEDCNEPIVPRGIEMRGCTPQQESDLWRSYHTMCRYLFKRCTTSECLQGVDDGIVKCLRAFCEGKRKLAIRCLGRSRNPFYALLYYLACVRGSGGAFVMGPWNIIYVCPGIFPCSVLTNSNGFRLDCCQVALMEEMVHLCQGWWWGQRPEGRAKAIVGGCYPNAGMCGLEGY